MESFFIQQTPSGGWGEPQYRPDLQAYTLENLRADNWYPLVLSAAELRDINVTRVITYELREDTVYQKHTFVPKEGEELTQAILVKWREIRIQRAHLLESCDWTQLGDAPLAADKKVAWATYRQQLRDITLQPDPFSIVWPVNPDGFNGTIGVARV